VAILDEIMHLEKFRECQQIRRMAARYRCDKILDDLYATGGEGRSAKEYVASRIGEVEDLIKGIKVRPGKPEISLAHVEGLVALLKLDYRTAIRYFAASMLAEAHNGSRFHLALVHMVGTRTYYRAEYQLRQILRDLSSTDENHRFHRLVRHNLARIETAREDGMMFNEDLIFYHLHKDLVPRRATVVEQPAGVAEERRLRVLKLTFEAFTKEALFAGFSVRGLT
jgi:hypothetical protein